MQHIARSERSIRRGTVSWEQSLDDLKVAESCMKSHPEKSCLQSTQSVVNALSSLLETEGYFQLPAFSPMLLLDTCLEMAPELEKIRSHCQVLDSTMERDILGNTAQKNIRFTSAFAKSCLRAGKSVQKEILHFRKSKQSAT